MSDIYKSLQREFKQNEETVRKAVARNGQIRDLLRQIDRVVGNKPPAPIAGTPKPRTRPLNAIALKILEVMVDGRVRTITTLGTRVLGHAPDPTEGRMLSNYCRSFVISGQFLRVKRGSYKAVKTEAAIGADTRVKQVKGGSK